MQLVKYSWIGWEPFLLARQGDAVFRLKLFQQDFSVTLGEKHCIGFLRDGRHAPCPENRKLDYGSNCSSCKLEDDFFMCMPCTGETCINAKRRDACREENYFIYLAAFDSVLKVGISFENRLQIRLVEQGADMAARIGYVRDGKDARSVEQWLMHHLKITDRMKGTDKHALLFGNPNNAAPRMLAALKALRKQAFDWLLEKPEIYDLRQYYRLERVLHQPSYLPLEDGKSIEGQVVAAKGNLIIFRTGQGFVAVNAHDMIGRKMAFTSGVSPAPATIPGVPSNA